MLRDNRPGERQGYITSRDVPYLTKDVSEPDRSSGLLRMVGEFALGAVVTHVSAMVLKGSVDDMARLSKNVAPHLNDLFGTSWVKNKAVQAAKDMKEFDEILERASGVVELKSGVRLAKEELIDRENSPAFDVLKQELTMRAARWARMAPYEIPAAIVTNKVLFEREQLKKEIKEGTFNPYNPVDWLGEGALDAAEYIAGDILLHGAVPAGRYIDRAMSAKSPGYVSWKNTVKATNAEHMQWLARRGHQLETVVEAIKQGSKDAKVAIKAQDLNPRSMPDLIGEGIIKVATGRSPKALKDVTTDNLRQAQIYAREIGLRIRHDLRDFNLTGSATRTSTYQPTAATLKAVSTIVDSGDSQSIGTQTVFGMFSEDVSAHLQNKYRLTKDQADKVMMVGRQSMRDTDVVRTVEHARRSSNVTRRGVMAHDIISLGTENDFDDEMRLLGLDKKMNFTKFMKGVVATAETLGEDLGGGRTRAQEMLARRASNVAKAASVVPDELARKIGTTRRVLPTTKHILKDGAAKNDLAHQALSALGYGDLADALKKSGNKHALWNKWVHVSGGNSEAAAQRLRGLLVSKNKAVYKEADRYNLLGLRRLSVDEMLAVDASKRTSEYGRTARSLPTDPEDRKRFTRGLNIMESRLGKRARDLNGDKGLFMSARGEIVDLRSFYAMAGGAKRWASEYFKLPVIGINPLQLLNVSDVNNGGLVKSMPQSTNVYAMRNLKGFNQYSPTFGVGASTFSFTSRGELNRMGNWTWGAAHHGTYARYARYGSGWMKESGARERSFFKGGGQDPNTTSGRIWNFLAIEQDTSTSLFHRLGRRLSRSEDPRVGIAKWVEKHDPGIISKRVYSAMRKMGFDSAADPRPVIKEDGRFRYMVEEWKRVASMGDDELIAHQRDVIRKRDGLRGADLNEKARREAVRIRQDTFDQIAGTLERNTDAGTVDYIATVLKNLKDISGNSVMPNFDLSTVDGIHQAIAHMDDVVKTSKAPRNIRDSLGHLARQVRGEMAHGADIGQSQFYRTQRKIVQFYTRLVGMTPGPGEAKNGILNLERIVQEAGADYRRGRMSIEAYNQVLGQVEAAKLRVHGQIDSTMVASVADAMRRTFGPDNTTSGWRMFYKEAKAEDKLAGGLNRLNARGLLHVIRSTFGNENWLHYSKSSLDDAGKTFDPFKGSNFIAMPSFWDKSGMGAALRSFSSSVVRGYETHGQGEVSGGNLGRTVGGMLGSSQGGMYETSGTVAGWHLINRVVDQFATVGLGIEGWRYNSPVEYYLKGVLGKRVVPIYAGFQAWELMKATPGIGVNGVMGAGAWVMGPGIGQARATVFDKTGANDFFQRLSDTMSLDEEAKFSRWGRTEEDERQYWEAGADPIRKGRWWLLSNERWKGGKVDYYRPNWYRMFTSRYKYTDEGRGSALEWAAFGNELSPLRYLDPYHYERKWGSTRPYPVSGDLFTGPWGALTPVLNATIGSIIKPKRRLTYDADQLEAIEYTTQHTEKWQGDTDAIQSTYKSGRMKVEDVYTLPGKTGSGSAAGSSSVSSVNQEQIARGGTKMTSRKMSRLAKKQAEMISQGSHTGSMRSDEIVKKMNDDYRGAASTAQASPPMFASYGKDSRGTGRMHVGDALVELPRRYNFSMQWQADPNNAKIGSGLGFRMGEFGYQFQEWAGIYGFMFGSVRSMLGLGSKDYSPSSPILQSAERAYGSERSFWDLDLGGLGDFVIPSASELGGLQASEIARRFNPHRRRDITEVNNIPNQMPEWMPGSDYMVDFKTGDPFIKVKLGEARLPGQGYERLNKLHPDELGQYGVFDRFKILADTAPWSAEYKAYQQIISKVDLSPELKSQATEIKRQVAERKKKHATKKYKWHGDLKTRQVRAISQNSMDPNLFEVEGYNNPVKLAGVNFAKSPEGRKAAEEFFRKHIEGRKITIKAGEPRADRERSIEAIMYAGSKNINAVGMDMINDGALGISQSQSESYAANVVKYGDRWAQFGKLWERISHADIPFKNKFLIQRDAGEYYQNKMVYGKQWQPWETPISSFIQPAMDSFTRDRGPIITPIFGGVGMGLLARGFIKAAPETMGLRRGMFAVGAVAGMTIAMSRLIGDTLRGQKWVPSRRRDEWAVDEYFDILSYVKWGSLYQQARNAAIEEEGVDPEAIASDINAGADDYRRKFQDSWDQAPIGGKPNRPESQKVYSRTGPATALALEYRRRMAGTMYGTDVTNADPMATMSGVPKRYRDLMQEMVDTPEDRRKGLLDTMPRMMRRILQGKWGYRIEKRPDLVAYFSKHELPGEDWEGWLPQVDLEDVKMKVIKHEGLDAAEFGYYDSQMSAAMAMPWAYPEIDEPTPGLRGDIQNQLAGMGIRDAVVQFINVPGSASGFDFNIMHDRREDIRGMLNGA